MKHKNTHIIGVSKGDVSEQGTENLSEEMITRNFPELVKEKLIQFQEAQSPYQDEPTEAHTKTHHN